MRRLTALIFCLTIPTLAVAQERSIDLGEPPILIDLTTPQHIEVDRNVLGGTTTWISVLPTASDVRIAVADVVVEGRNLLISFRPCSRVPFRINKCQADAELLDDSSVRVTAPPDAVLVRVTGQVAAGAGREPRESMIRIELNYRPWQLQWSGGFMMSSARDPRLRLEREVDGSQTAVASGEGDYAQAIVALGQLLHSSVPSLGLSFGVGTESADLQTLSLLGGVTYAFRPGKLVDSVFVTVGQAYVPVGRLKPEYDGVGAIPNGVGLDDVVLRQREFHPFAAITFRVASGTKVKTVLGGGAAGSP